jgi:hypothetical protein
MNTRDKKAEEYIRKVKEIFPEIDISSIFSLYNGDNPISGRIILSKQADSFRKLFNFNKPFNIIHYTSIDTLFNILNMQNFRMYNCFNLNDRREIETANLSFNIGMTETEITGFKQNNFVASFCEYDMEKQYDNFLLWNLYGMKGKGAGLVFEIENISDSWEEVYIGKVMYSNNKNDGISQKFIEFLNFHKDFNKEHQLFENTPSIFSAIALHYKYKIWNYEKEVRIFAYCPFDEIDLISKSHEGQNNYLSSKMSHTVNSAGRIVSYLSLPLNKENEIRKLENILHDKSLSEYFYSSIPHLKLKRIVLGYDVSDNTFNETDKILNWLTKENKIDFVQLGYTQLKTNFFKPI